MKTGYGHIQPPPEPEYVACPCGEEVYPGDKCEHCGAYMKTKEEMLADLY